MWQWDANVQNLFGYFLIWLFGVNLCSFNNSAVSKIQQDKFLKSPFFGKNPQHSGNIGRKYKGTFILMTEKFQSNLISCRFFDFWEKKRIKIDSIKGTLIQIWRSVNMFLFQIKKMLRYHIKTSFTFRDMRTSVCEKLVYKQSETIEYVKN